ncbi:MAG: replication factor C large subunit [Methanobrevibacter sp.]|nr:replication factor C large subunit [Methanobrevibacter sp.]
MLWTEKYRPKTFSEVIGNGKEKKEIQAWLDGWKNGIPQPALLLVGPPGTGKTTMAHIIANEFSEYVELNASDKRSQDVLLNTIGESSATRSLFGENRKLLIMDEVDGIHGTNDRGGTRALNKIIKESKQPIVMMANDFYSKKLTTIKKNSHVIKMSKIRSNSLNAFLKKVLKSEGIEADPELVKKLAKRSSGDIRSALNTLQAIVENGEELSEESLNATSQKDNTATIFDTVTRVLKSKDPVKVKRTLFENNEEPSLVMEYIAENIPREYESRKEIKKAYDMISKADLFFGRTRATRNYGFWRYASDFMGTGVAMSKRETYKKFTKVQSPGSFSLMGRSRGKRALRDNIAAKMEEKMHVSLEIAYTMFPYFEIMFQDDETAWEISDFLELDDDEIKRFRKKKIPKKVVTKMEAIKAEMRAEELEKWRQDVKDGIFAYASQNDARDIIEEAPDVEGGLEIDGHFESEANIEDEIFIDDSDSYEISDDELDEIAQEIGMKKQSRLNSLGEDDSSKSKRKSRKRTREPVEEPRDKGQTSLFNF